MDKLELNLEIPVGYRIIERTNETDLYSACDELRRRKQKYITGARRVGDKAIITRHRIKCPHCGYEKPSYLHCLKNSVEALPKKSEIELSAWADIQLSMLEQPAEDLLVQLFYNFTGEYICEKCGYASDKFNCTTALLLNYTDGKLYVKKQIKNLSELVSIKWLKGDEDICFPLYEQVVFDFESSITWLELISRERVICTAPVTDSEVELEDDIIIDLFCKNRILKRTVRNMFEKITGYKIPFSVNELDFYKFVNFLRFRGFPKNFYDAIPFWAGSWVVDDSFGLIAKRLNTPDSAMRLLQESSIPFCKSVKRLFAQKSGLFFYLNECDFLFDIFKDVNLFCTFLNQSFAFNFLSMMHYYDNSIKMFLSDYSRVLGKTRFAHKLSLLRDITNYAIHYAAMSEYVKKKEQMKWLEGVDVFDDMSLISNIRNDISVPLRFVFDNMSNSVVDKHKFRCLRSKNECVMVGRIMKNCLVNWDYFSNPVVVVYKSNKIVAAIEVYDGAVIQAKGVNNESIIPDSDLYRAIEKWCERNNIELDPEEMNGPFMR